MAQERHTEPRRARLAGVDVARGLALIGMFIAHLGVPLSAFAVSGEPYAIASGGADPVNLADRVAVLVFDAVSGRSAALFALLAGVSLTFIAGRRDVVTSAADRGRARVKIVVRAALLVLIGYLLASFHSAAVILHYYGLYFLLALPLLWLRGRVLALVGGLVILIGPTVGNLAYGATELFGEDWPSLILGTSHDPFFSYVLPRGPGAAFELSAPTDGLLDLLATGLYPAVAFMGYVIAGMLVGRLDLRSASVRARLVLGGLAGAVVGYGGSWVAVRALPDGLPTLFGVPAEDLVIAEPHSNTTFEVLGNTGAALVVLGLCLIVADRAGRLLDPLASVGTMTLTLYSAHIVLMWVTDPLGEGYGRISDVLAHDAELYLIAAFIVATVWRSRFGSGPMERMLTRAANGTAERVLPREKPRTPVKT
ncbi:putative membrane protein YeiB [Nocardiopsis mwathae]|uniref:Putative membrane protein YeiB n=1 Tax=Nocardiopsis mwathae TaxID=1472723 RepID=A0A7W9YM90_9ACTN|nr:putative membrane protein YeiB [Nocardiopsis mwathae]